MTISASPAACCTRNGTKWKDLANKDALQTVGGVLVGMGLTGSALQIVAVAVAVYILLLGLDAYCRKA